MTLLETTIETTLTGAPAWLETLIALLVGLFGPKLAKFGVAVVKKPKDAAKAAPLILIPLLLAGCALFESPNKSWVEADRATHDLVAPEYDAYVDADPTLNAMQKNVRKSATATWRVRLEQNEKAVK